MTSIEIQYANELIASFMPNIQLITPRNPVYPAYYRIYNKDGIGMKDVKRESLCFHSSWGEIMKVVDEIELMEDVSCVRISKAACEVIDITNKTMMGTYHDHNTTKIMLVFHTIVRYITEHYDRSL